MELTTEQLNQLAKELVENLEIVFDEIERRKEAA